MNVKYMFSLIAVLFLFLLGYVGAEVGGGGRWLLGIGIPYVAVICFIGGIIYRVIDWARSPVPFRIPTTAGQQKSLPWIKHSSVDNPTTIVGVVIRMALEVLFFRSLFRNSRMQIKQDSKITYEWEIWLWAAALAFHWAFAVVVVRHLRFFMEPVPGFVKLLETLDGFFRIEIVYDFIKIGLPGVYISGLVLLGAVTFLFFRRVLIPKVKYISIASDFFPLFLIIGIAFSGLFMRYLDKVDITAIKAYAMGLVTGHPVIPESIGSMFFVHLLLVSVLLIYFPFSKLMHMAGIFLSPTRNLTTDTRAKRHINPWNYPVPVHTYEEYEDDFREKMKEAGLPVEKE